MRIKVLLGAALVATSALTATAQNVYSLNVVGYVNVPLVDGFNMIANPLDKDGNGTNNTTTSVFGQTLPANSTVYAWTGAAWDIASYSGKTKAWDKDIALNPGRGFWLSIPAGTFGAGVTGSVTTVGNVLQNSLVNPNLAAAGGFSVVGSMAPVQGKITTDLKLKATDKDTVYFWNGASWDIYSYSAKAGGWTPSEPVVNVGQGFWLSSATSSTWSNYFVVPQQ